MSNNGNPSKSIDLVPRYAKKNFYMALAAVAIAIWLWVFSKLAMLGSTNQLPGSYRNPDTNRNLYEIIESRGFQYESHFITTDSGYILQLVRIVNPFVKDGTKLKPVLMFHGFQCSGTLWVLATNGTLAEDGHYYEYDENNRRIDTSSTVGNTLGFVLATRGYDVWLANYRGSIYSTNHTTLDTNDSQFWHFSIDEMVDEDMPALITYVQAYTRRKSIAYIGHSQGTFMLFGLLSKRPEFSNVIKPFIALSPVVFVNRTLTPLKHFTPFRELFRSFPRRSPFFINYRHLYPNICDNIYIRKICYSIYYYILGSFENNVDMNRMGVYVSNVLMGSSSWNAAHFLQMLTLGYPSRFDHGTEKNLAKYGVETPPRYNISNIDSAHIALIYTASDWFNHLEAVDQLKDNLKVKLIDDYQVPDPSWNHLDLIWAKKVGQYVNTRVLNILSRY